LPFRIQIGNVVADKMKNEPAREATNDHPTEFLERRGRERNLLWQLRYAGCGPQPKAPRLPVKVNGKRVLAVDVHAHCYFREAISLMGDGADKVLPPVKGVPEHFIAIEQRLKEMDAMAIDMEVLSINPFWYGKDRDTAAQIVKVQNEKLAELCAARPERFSAFASLTLQYPDLAAQQLETAVKKQGLRGAAIGGSVLGEDFSDPKFHPVWAKAERTRRGAVHPSTTRPSTIPKSNLSALHSVGIGALLESSQSPSRKRTFADSAPRCA